MEEITVELNRKNIEKLLSDAGGFTRAVIEGLGMEWPVKNGWRAKLEASGKRMKLDDFKRLIELRNPVKKQKPKLKNKSLNKQIEIIESYARSVRLDGYDEMADEIDQVVKILKKVRGLPKFLGLN